MYQQVRIISHIDPVIDCRENFNAFMYNESLNSYIWNLGSSPTGTTSCMKVVPYMMVICCFYFFEETVPSVSVETCHTTDECDG
jgi:hypothetical protein